MLKDLVVSVSGGKDSTATYALAVERFGSSGFEAVFADTGLEHPVTLNYVRNMHEFCGGPKVHWVKADFRERLRAKLVERARASSAWAKVRDWFAERDWTSGSAFFDMVIFKGRVPSSMAQFCTENLKLEPIKTWFEAERGDADPVMWVGIRAGESERRAKMPPREFNPFFDCWTERPILRWSAMDVFDFLKRKRIPVNPLYDAGFERVGCYPCIHARKSELARLEAWAWDRLAEWEKMLGRTWFAYGTIPLTPAQQMELAAIPLVEVTVEVNGILGADSVPDPALVAEFKNRNSPTVEQVREWSRTSRGGQQFDMFAAGSKDVPSCMSTWGACE